MSDMIEICSSIEQLAFSGTLDLHRLCYPKSHGLESLNAQLYGDTHISTEGLVDRIKSKLRKVKGRIGQALDKLVLSLNTFIGKLGLLSKLQKEELKEVKQGKRRLRSASLPISSKTLVTTAKVIGLLVVSALSFFAALKAEKVSSSMQKSREADSVIQVHGKKVKENEILHINIQYATQEIEEQQRRLKRDKKQGASAEEIERTMKKIEKIRDDVLKWKSRLHVDAETVKIEKEIKRAEKIEGRIYMSQPIFLLAAGSAFADAILVVRKGIAKLLSPILEGIRGLHQK